MKHDFRSSRQKGRYLTEEQGRVIVDICSKHDYFTNRLIVHALPQTEAYIQAGKTGPYNHTYFGEILHGKKTLPAYIAQGILELCENDSRLDFLSCLEGLSTKSRFTGGEDHPFHQPDQQYQRLEELIGRLELVVSKFDTER